ncbi:hypothetical protein P879_01227 [Paragonimus westermani]|uniref:Uncharacterized protein n=1 Tax=Paragonimus westermani TaxID=34504 RepID=A0A8T0DTC5_9TREM|nr:hypothetical protein P879_01227 [Paragonimus westermani]
MGERRKSLGSWFRTPKLFSRNKNKTNSRTDDLVHPAVNINVDGLCLNSSATALKDKAITQHQSGEQTVPEKSDVLSCSLHDDFDLFLHYSNSPTSNVQKQSIVDNRKRSHARNPIVSDQAFQDTISTQSGREMGMKTTEDLRRVVSVLERKPHHPQTSYSRRDLARASFRSRSVRERGTTKKLQCPQNAFENGETIKPGATESGSGDFGNDRFKWKRWSGHGEHSEETTAEREDNFCRVRSFKVTRKGIVNLGDTYRTRSVVGLSHTSDSAYSNRPRAIHEQTDLTNPSQTNLYSSPKPLFHPSADRSRVGSLHSPTCNAIETSPFPSMNQPNITLWQTHDTAIVPTVEDEDAQQIRIQIVGFPNVGKTALCRQMITSDFLGSRMESTHVFNWYHRKRNHGCFFISLHISVSEDTIERLVTVELNQQTWNLLLIDNFGEAAMEEVALVNSIRSKETHTHTSDTESASGITSEKCIPHLLPHSKSSCSTLLKDAKVYLLVYAVDDQRSYEYISRVLKLLIKDSETLDSKVFIVVANKSDLVRSRMVSSERGKRLAHTYGCKYFEISTAINHLVDELLVEVILQVEHLRSKSVKLDLLRVASLTERRLSNLKSSGEALVHYFRRHLLAKSCENIRS